MLTELENFFVKNHLAIRAADSIKDGREIAIEITDLSEEESDGSKTYTFSKISGKNTIAEGTPKSADVTFIIPSASMREIAGTKFDSIGQVGLRIFEKMLSDDPKQKIRVKLHGGFLNLMTGGYFGVLTSGGSEVAQFLAGKGIASISKWKDIIAKMKTGG